MTGPPDILGGPPYRLRIPAELSRVAEVREWMGRIGEVAGLAESRVFDLQVVTSEAIANGIEHAASEVEVAAWVMPDRLLVEITNDGVFQPGIYKDGTSRRRGLGLPLMVSLADQVHVSRLPGERTRVSLTFLREPLAQPGAGTPRPAPGRRMLLGWLLLPLPALVVLVLVFWGLDLRAVHESQPLVTAFNTLFVSAACFGVAAFAASSALRTGSLAVVLLGAGSVVIGLGFLLAGPLFTAPNNLVTVHNTSVLVAGVLFAAGGMLAVLPRPPLISRSRPAVLSTAYLLSAAFVVLVALLAVERLLPAFVDRGGYTGVRTGVLLFAVIAFVAAAVGYTWLYGRQASWFVLFAAAAFVCFAVGLGVLLILRPALGSPINWAGRAGQWMGGLYLLSAIFSLQRSGGSALALERSLHEAEDRYQALVNTSPEAILVHSQGRFVFANPAAAHLFGASDSRAILGEDVRRFLHPQTAEEELARIDQAYSGGTAPPVETTLLRLDGTPFPAEVNRSQVRWEGRVGVQTVIRDISERKQVEGTLRLGEERQRPLAGENEWLDRQQLDIAETLQSALVHIPAQIGRVRLGHLHRSATEAARVGGDFYDVFEVKDGRIALLVGEVSGHGIDAARTAILVKDVVHAYCHQSLRPHEVLRRTNRLLIQKRLPGFVTLFLGVLDSDTGALRYSSAGHPEPLLSRAAGGLERLGVGAPALPVLAQAAWTSRPVQLQEGDVLVLYTDGVIEARSKDEFFGEERLWESVRRIAGDREVAVEKMPELVLQEVLTFSNGTLQDDAAVLALSLASAGQSDVGGRH